MARTWLALIGLLLLAGCHGGGSVSGADGGSDAGFNPVDDEDSGPHFKNPNQSDTLGPFTGKYDVNGAGLFFAIQVDGRIAIELNDPSQLFLGRIDGGAFAAETVFPEQESCGPVTLQGAFDDDAGYRATEDFCAAGQPASGLIAGHRFLYPNIYRQDLAWSGAYDATESPASTNTCGLANGTHPLTIGVARDLDGGAVTAVLLGDGLKEELVFGEVNEAAGVLSGRGRDSSGQDTSSFSLFFIDDGGVSGLRRVDLGDGGFGCTADLQFFGAKR